VRVIWPSINYQVSDIVLDVVRLGVTFWDIDIDGDRDPDHTITPLVDADANPTDAYVIVDVEVDVACGNVIALTGFAVPADVDTAHPAVDLVTATRVYPV
jgi:hypothetical protein